MRPLWTRLGAQYFGQEWGNHFADVHTGQSAWGEALTGRATFAPEPDS
jgi:hypothetical protein